MSLCRIVDASSASSVAPLFTLALSFGPYAGSLAAQDNQVTITTSGPNGSNSTIVTATPGGTVQVNMNGSVITTSTTIAGGTRETGGDDLTLSAGDDGGRPKTTDITPSRLDFDWLDGLRFGGIIGASLDNALTYDCHGPVMPELTGNVGVGGASIGLGARWSLSKKTWELSSTHLAFDSESFTALSLRGIAAYRWEDHQGHPSFWRGMPSDGGWYLGAEVGAVIDGLGVTGQITWGTSGHDPGPHYTVSYGLGF